MSHVESLPTHVPNPPPTTGSCPPGPAPGPREPGVRRGMEPDPGGGARRPVPHHLQRRHRLLPRRPPTGHRHRHRPTVRLSPHPVCGDRPTTGLVPHPPRAMCWVRRSDHPFWFRPAPEITFSGAAVLSPQSTSSPSSTRALPNFSGKPRVSKAGVSIGVFQGHRPFCSWAPRGSSPSGWSGTRSSWLRAPPTE